jgi:hypothetical protein
MVSYLVQLLLQVLLALARFIELPLELLLVVLGIFLKLDKRCMELGVFRLPVLCVPTLGQRV